MERVNASRIVRWLGLWIAVSGSSACTGQILVFEDPCVLVECGDGLICKLGECVPPPGPCNLAEPVGVCPTGSVCAKGVCFARGTEPPVCSAGVNGLCPLPDHTCTPQGTCEPITPSNACAVGNPDGACDGGELCILGLCYRDDGIACSPENTDGACKSNEACQSGACAPATVTTCSTLNFTGSCPAWQACIQGTCRGPAPPDACTPDDTVLSVFGRCPVDHACVNGNCVLVNDATNGCNPARPTGLCPDGAACSLEGRCIAIDPALACAPDNLGGLCPAGNACNETGTCGVVLCDSGGQGCGPGETCVGGQCVAMPCSGANPRGACPDPINEACEGGACVSPSCSAEFPNGSCPVGLECQNGACTPPPCSTTHPSGPCPEVGDVCQGGSCTEGPCAANNLDGTCDGTSPSCHPIVGCPAIATTCCNDTINAQVACTSGVCVGEPCSASNTLGRCPNGFYCNAGTCEVAPCSPFFLAGVCPDGQRCFLGSCAVEGCSGNESVCGDDICDTVNNVCKPAACSASALNGFCPLGQACCNNDLNAVNSCTLGTCIEPPCSNTYPGGTCPTGEVCAGGECKVPPCSTTFTNGTCGPNLTCCNDAAVTASKCTNGQIGSCVLDDCSVTNTKGRCPSGQTCSGGSCVAFTCSVTFPFGDCPAGQICDNGTCAAVCNTCTGLGESDCTARSDLCEWQTNTCVFKDDCSALSQTPCDAATGCNWTGSACELLKPTLLGNCPSGLKCVEGRCAPGCSGDADCDNIPDTAENLTTTCTPLTSEGTCIGTSPCAWINDPPTCYYDTDGDKIPDGLDRDADGDGVPDEVEAGNSPPQDSDLDLTPDFRDLDSDGDSISDAIEAGSAPTVPANTDGADQVDMLDTDSDNDGILDRCEVTDRAGGLCKAQHSTIITSTNFGCSGLAETPCNNDNDCIWDTFVTPAACATVYDLDGDGTLSYRDTDSDGDGIPDSIERLENPTDSGSDSDQNGFDRGGSDTDTLPDYRDKDSDGDTVADSDEDVNGDGKVNCLAAGSGACVADSRASPTCGSYNYNPGCEDNEVCTGLADATKCLFSESSRIHTDTDVDLILDQNDGNKLVCAADSLKPINIFYNQTADFAIALETSFDDSVAFTRGLAFDDTTSSNGSRAVAGFVLQRTPATSVITLTPNDSSRELIEKALAQELLDRTTMAGATGVSTVTQVLNRNFTTFDGYGAVVSRYDVVTGSSTKTNVLRDNLVKALDNTVTLDTSGISNNYTATSFTLLTETLYRYDNDVSAGSVLIVGAILPTGTDQDTEDSYTYRTDCSNQTYPGECDGVGGDDRPGCTDGGSACTEDTNYQIPLFFADNITNGSAVAQYGDGVDSLCQALIQEHPKLDFLWVVDDSVSMEEEIDQVLTSAQLFFSFLDNSEADYRVGLTSTAQTGGTAFPPELHEVQDSIADGEDGMLIGSFTGAVAGRTTTTSSIDPSLNRDFAYDCDPAVTARCATNGCGDSSQECCSACGSGTINNPSCYFASRLPCTDGSHGAEYGLVMGQWATHRADVPSVCSTDATISAGQSACDASPVCRWIDSCEPNYCQLSTNDDVLLQCIGTSPEALVSEQAPAGCSQGLDGSSSDTCRHQSRDTLDSSRPERLCNGDTIANCNTTVDNIRTTCQGYSINQSNCEADANCYWTGSVCNTRCAAGSDSSSCGAIIGCFWHSGNSACVDCGSPTNGPNETECDATNGCFWDDGDGSCKPDWCACELQGGTVSTCGTHTSETPCDNAIGCRWQTSTCVPCSHASVTQGVCEEGTDCYWDGGECYDSWCEWTGSTCQAPTKRRFRTNAEKVAVFLADEEDCYLKSEPGASGCTSSVLGTGILPTGGLDSYADSATRTARVESFRRYYQSRDFTVFSIVGDKANPAAPPSITSNGGCDQTRDACGYSNSSDCNGTPQDCTALATEGQCDIFSVAPHFCEWDNPGMAGNCRDKCANNSSEGDCTTDDGDTNLECSWTGSACVRIAPSCTWLTADSTCYAMKAEAGQAYIDVSEGTGGGWGSICATNLFPTIEGIVIASLGKASEYTLEGNKEGKSVQPIPSTIKVAVEVCTVDNEYPSCLPSNSSQMITPTRSRTNGFDYDPTTNALLLYGNARPKTDGDIVVSFRFWEDNTTAAAGNLDCPCPTGSLPTCACPTAGEACGTSGTSASPTNNCTSNSNQNDCEGTPGCTWNTADGGVCYTSGVCEPDPTCGGGCASGEVCDSTTGLCICDTTCGGGCPGPGYTCNTSGPSCGSCTCDTTCGGDGTCPAGLVCDNTTGDATCGLCIPDPACGGACLADSGNCPSDQASCEASSTCRWAPWENSGAGACETILWQSCNSDIGVCEVDIPLCQSECDGPNETCDLATGTCTCDGLCNLGSNCDSTPGSTTLGQCICDTTCGGNCPSGQVCNTDTSSATCGICIIDTTCGGSCVLGEVCDALTGLCIRDPNCGAGCPIGFVCDSLTRSCVPAQG